MIRTLILLLAFPWAGVAHAEYIDMRGGFISTLGVLAAARLRVNAQLNQLTKDLARETDPHKRKAIEERIRQLKAQRAGYDATTAKNAYGAGATSDTSLMIGLVAGATSDTSLMIGLVAGAGIGVAAGALMGSSDGSSSGNSSRVAPPNVPPPPAPPPAPAIYPLPPAVQATAQRQSDSFTNGLNTIGRVQSGDVWALGRESVGKERLPTSTSASAAVR